jgi:hypothetical protein
VTLAVPCQLQWPTPAVALACRAISHLDVVPAPPANWTYPPFAGTVADGCGRRPHFVVFNSAPSKQTCLDRRLTLVGTGACKLCSLPPCLVCPARFPSVGSFVPLAFHLLPGMCGGVAHWT